MRYSLCARCDCQWRVDRLSCPICGNKNPGTLHYFCGEGRRPTVSTSATLPSLHQDDRLSQPEEPDPSLEDLASLHLDIRSRPEGLHASRPTVQLRPHLALSRRERGGESGYHMRTISPSSCPLPPGEGGGEGGHTIGLFEAVERIKDESIL